MCSGFRRGGEVGPCHVQGPVVSGSDGLLGITALSAFNSGKAMRSCTGVGGEVRRLGRTLSGVGMVFIVSTADSVGGCCPRMTGSLRRVVSHSFSSGVGMNTILCGSCASASGVDVGPMGGGVRRIVNFVGRGGSRLKDGSTSS